MDEVNHVIKSIKHIVIIPLLAFIYSSRTADNGDKPRPYIQETYRVTTYRVGLS